MGARAKTDAAWTTKTALRQMLGMSESGLDKVRRSLSNAHEERRGKIVWVYLPDWLRAWARYTSGVLDVGDSASGDSIWLEEKRKYEALRTRSKYEQEQRQLIAEHEVAVLYQMVASHLRQASEAMCADCQTLMDQALGDAETELEQARNDQDGERPPTE